MKAVGWKAILFACLGTIFLVAGALFGLHTWRFTQTASHAAGTVICENYGCHHVEVRFKTAAGEMIEYPQNGDICLHTAQNINVLYDPSMPLPTATVDSIGALWGNTFWASLMGVVFVLPACLGRFGSRFIYFKPGR